MLTLISALFRLIAEDEQVGMVLGGLDHPLVRYFSKDGDIIEHYKALDDFVVWGAIHSIAVSGPGLAKEIARRLLDRNRMWCLDVQLAFPQEQELQRRLKHRLDKTFEEELNKFVFRDTAKLSLYGEIGADDSRAQKRLMTIQLKNLRLKEITDFADRTIAQTGREKPFERYYFLHESDYTKAQSAVCEIGEHK